VAEKYIPWIKNIARDETADVFLAAIKEG